jgi:hypothetical protein
MRTLLFLLLSLPVLVLPALGHAETPATWDVQQLMQSLAQVKEARATFVESKFLRVLNRPLKSSGTLLFQAPGHLEKHTLSPKAESLVLDQGVLTIDSKARNIKRTLVLQEYPAIWAFVESIRSTMAGDLPTLQRFYQIELAGDAARWKMKLLPLEQNTRDVISEIRISGHGNWVDSVETKEANGDRAQMKVVKDTP